MGFSTKYEKVRVAVTTLDGEVLDYFYVTHARALVDDDGDFEFVGRPIPETELARRIGYYVKDLDKHTFQPVDGKPDTCCVCGKIKAWPDHV